MQLNATATSCSEFLEACADQKRAQGLDLDADAFEQRARQARQLEIDHAHLQREGVERDAFIRGYKHGACHYIGGDSTEELHEAASWAADHQDEEAGNFGKPQQEAPGAVAFSFAGPDGKNSIHDTWFPMKDLPAWQKWVTLREGHNVIYAYPTPPAPVDVRVRWREWLKHALQQWPEAEAALIATVGAMGPLADITQADIDLAKVALGGGGRGS